MSFDVGAPYFGRSFAFEYGIASKDGRLSDFLSTRSERSALQSGGTYGDYGPYGRDPAGAGAFFGPSLNVDDDVLNNFYYKFGKGNTHQIQVLSD